MLLAKGCSVTRKWILSQIAIYDKEQVDMLADNRQKAHLCKSPKCTLNWLHRVNDQKIIKEWTEQTINPPIPLRQQIDHSLAFLPRYQAINIQPTKCHSTKHDESFFNPRPKCECCYNT